MLNLKTLKQAEASTQSAVDYWKVELAVVRLAGLNTAMAERLLSDESKRLEAVQALIKDAEAARTAAIKDAAANHHESSVHSGFSLAKNAL